MLASSGYQSRKRRCARWLHPLAFAFLVVLIGCSSRQSATAGGAEEIPFTRLDVLGAPARLLFVRSDSHFEIETDRSKWSLPAGVVPIEAVRVPMGHELLIGRAIVTNELRMFHLRPDSIIEARVTIAGKRFSQFHVHAAARLADQALLFVYDYEESIPPGRTVSVVREGIDVYRVDATADEVRLQRLGSKLELGALDTRLSVVHLGGGLLVCGMSACYLAARTPAGVEFHPVAHGAHTGWSYLQISSDGVSAFALARRDQDDRFSPPPGTIKDVFAVCPVLPTSPCSPINPAEDATTTKIPVALSVVDGRPQLTFFRFPDDAVEMLRMDLVRLPSAGLQYFGINNTEGRVSWGQHHWLLGLADLASEAAHLPGDPSAAAALARTARRRLDLEAHVLAMVGTSEDPWLTTRRYSIDRSPLASLVHVGRYRALVASIETRMDQPLGHSAKERADRELRAPDVVIERFERSPSGWPSLGIRKGVRFWADGANVPWNYQSAYIEGLVAGQMSSSECEVVRGMLTHFATEENWSAKPSLWNYSRGRFFDGWTAESGTSINTPVWAGDKQNTAAAHISYRSMDALAWLAARNAGCAPQPTDIGAYIPELIARGYLYPAVASRLTPMERPSLSAPLAAMYARLGLAHELQNQVWALRLAAR